MLRVELKDWIKNLKFYIADITHLNLYFAPEFEALIAKDTVKVELEDNPGNYIVRLLEDEKEIYYTSVEYDIIDNQITGKFDYKLDSKYEEILGEYIDYLKQVLSVLSMTLDDFKIVYNEGE